MKSTNTALKVAFALFINLNFTLSSVFAQNDTMYVMKNGEVINKQSVKTSDVDSIIFYKPTTSSSAIVIDADGNVYQTVTIGTQIWMAENLKTTKYNDGTAIPLANNYTILSTPCYFWYDNDSVAYAQTYGALYNWYTVNTGNLCPAGWHVPTDTEWTTLTTYLGGENVAGNKLKETGTTHWFSNYGNPTNETGFTALPGGYRYENGSSFFMSQFGYWLSATEYSGNYAWLRIMDFDNGGVRREYNSKRHGYSVRCIKD